MATAFLRALRRGRPGSGIVVAMKAKLSGVFEESPLVDEIIPLATDSAGEALRLGVRRRGAFETAFILPNSFKSALLPWFAGARERVGYRGQGRGLLLTVGVAPPPAPGRRRRAPEPMPHYWRRLTDAAGIAWDGDHPELSVGPVLERQAAERARELGIAEGEELVGLSPGAAFGPSKQWIPERYGEVASRLYEALGLRAIVFVAPGEEPLGRAIIGTSRSPVISTVENPLPLSLLKAFVRRCRILITTDSGTRHFGVALRVPTLTLIGPTDPRYTSYCLERQEVVSHPEVACLGCHHKVCPIDHRCMAWLGAEEVARRALALLERVSRA
jgi:heptosyltransferase II